MVWTEVLPDAVREARSRVLVAVAVVVAIALMVLLQELLRT